VSPTSSARESIGAYTIQVAALTDAVNARSIVVYLKGIGFGAYLVEPPDGSTETLHRVRVGRYDSRLAAQRAVSRLEDNLGLKLWVMRAPTGR
jgi:cell division septation protein DedD